MSLLAHRLQMPSARFDSISDAVKWCEMWIQLQVDCCGDKKLAAVFDIDATLITRNGRIEDVCAMFQMCRELNITVFLITARSEEGRSYTDNQMEQMGISGYKRLLMHPSHVRCDTHGAGREKLRHRERICKHGYQICLNAGDALHDHFHTHDSPPLKVIKASLMPNDVYTIITGDGVAHLKLPG